MKSFFNTLWSSFLATMCIYGMYFASMSTLFGTVKSLNVDSAMTILSVVPAIVLFFAYVYPLRCKSDECCRAAPKKPLRVLKKPVPAKPVVPVAPRQPAKIPVVTVVK